MKDGHEIKVEISAPYAASDGPEFRCDVRIPAVLDEAKWIAGVDAAQAVQLAGGFAASMITHAGYVWVGDGPAVLEPLG